jgi:hypothetical protein
VSETAPQSAQLQEPLAGPPAWALGIALVVSGNIFEFWALRVQGTAPTIILGLLALAARVAGLGILIRWILPFRTWWAYVVFVILAAGIVAAVIEMLVHFT